MCMVAWVTAMLTAIQHGVDTVSINEGTEECGLHRTPMCGVPTLLQANERVWRGSLAACGGPVGGPGCAGAD